MVLNRNPTNYFAEVSDQDSQIYFFHSVLSVRVNAESGEKVGSDRLPP